MIYCLIITEDANVIVKNPEIIKLKGCALILHILQPKG